MMTMSEIGLEDLSRRAKTSLVQIEEATEEMDAKTDGDQCEFRHATAPFI